MRALIFHVPKCLHAYVSIYIFLANVSMCAHFSRTYVPTTTQKLGTDIYPADVNSDENLYFNTSGVFFFFFFYSLFYVDTNFLFINLQIVL